MPMRLWISTCLDDFSSEFDDIEEMFHRGLTRLILDKRAKKLYKTTSSNAPIQQEIKYSNATFEEYERWLLSLPIQYRDNIWVHGTPDIAEKLEVRGCVCEAYKFMGNIPESWKRISCIALCKNKEEIEKLPSWISGALIGPIFQPLSAIGPVETLGIDFLVKKTSKIPQILFGGVDIDTIDEFKKYSPMGVMALGGIWNYANPINAFEKLNSACCSNL